MNVDEPWNLPKVSLKKTGEKIRELRQKRNLTVNNLRDILGLMDSNTIYHWETGRNFPSINHLVGLSVIFNIRVDNLLQLED